MNMKIGHVSALKRALGLASLSYSLGGLVSDPHAGLTGATGTARAVRLGMESQQDNNINLKECQGQSDSTRSQSEDSVDAEMEWTRILGEEEARRSPVVFWANHRRTSTTVTRVKKCTGTLVKSSTVDSGSKVSGSRLAVITAKHCIHEDMEEVNLYFGVTDAKKANDSSVFNNSADKCGTLSSQTIETTDSISGWYTFPENNPRPPYTLRLRLSQAEAKKRTMTAMDKWEADWAVLNLPTEGLTDDARKLKSRLIEMAVPVYHPDDGQIDFNNCKMHGFTWDWSKQRVEQAKLTPEKWQQGWFAWMNGQTGRHKVNQVGAYRVNTNSAVVGAQGDSGAGYLCWSDSRAKYYHVGVYRGVKWRSAQCDGECPLEQGKDLRSMFARDKSNRNVKHARSHIEYAKVEMALDFTPSGKVKGMNIDALMLLRKLHGEDRVQRRMVEQASCGILCGSRDNTFTRKVQYYQEQFKEAELLRSMCKT